VVQGVLAVDATLLAVARTFHVGKVATIWKIMLPATLPYLLAGMRVSLSLALIVSVVAEMMAGNQCIGHYLVLMQYAVRPQDMYASILLLALGGYLRNRIFIKIEQRLIRWYSRIRSAAGSDVTEKKRFAFDNSVARSGYSRECLSVRRFNPIVLLSHRGVQDSVLQ
jgi:NitT/TauT family transport system permease protein/sulfonate transport system permease protein